MTLVLIIAFFVLDTIIVCAVLFFVHGNKNKSRNANTFGADTKESPFHSSTHASNAAPLNGTPLNNDEIVNLLRQGRKNEAVKIYRERTNLGLAEAKDAVEALERQM
jgi:hypothetical protein